MAVNGSNLCFTKQLIDLQQKGVPKEEVVFNRVTLTTDKWLCLRHQSCLIRKSDQLKKAKKGKCFASVVNLHKPTDHSSSWYAIADRIVMCPSQPLLALQSGRRFQVFDVTCSGLDRHDRLLRFKAKLPSAETPGDVVYWTWANDFTVAVVTRSTVYHWTIGDGGLAPSTKPAPGVDQMAWMEQSAGSRAVRGILEPVFSRHERLNSCQIVDYKVSHDLACAALVGLSDDPTTNQIVGRLQVYKFGERTTQYLEGHACCFLEHQFADSRQPVTVLCYAVRVPSSLVQRSMSSSMTQSQLAGDEAQSAVITIRQEFYELLPVPKGCTVHQPKSDTVLLDYDAAQPQLPLSPFSSPSSTSFLSLPDAAPQPRLDLPVAILPCPRLSAVFTLTKFGRLLLADVETGRFLVNFGCVTFGWIVVRSVLESATMGLLVVTREGVVVAVRPDWRALVRRLEEEAAERDVSFRDVVTTLERRLKINDTENAAAVPVTAVPRSHHPKRVSAPAAPVTMRTDDSASF